MSNFTYEQRYANTPSELPHEAVTALENRDRELEQYLYGAARTWPLTVYADADGTPYDISSLFTVRGTRWERLRGRFVVASFVIERTAADPGGLTNSLALGVSIPDDAPPAAPVVGYNAPVGGNATIHRWQFAVLTLFAAGAWYAIDQRAVTGHWLVPFNRPSDIAGPATGGSGAMQVSDTKFSTNDVLVGTLMWRT